MPVDVATLVSSMVGGGVVGSVVAAHCSTVFSEPPHATVKSVHDFVTGQYLQRAVVSSGTNCDTHVLQFDENVSHAGPVAIVVGGGVGGCVTGGGGGGVGCGV